jgi:hypothetical protein
MQSEKDKAVTTVQCSDYPGASRVDCGNVSLATQRRCDAWNACRPSV